MTDYQVLPPLRRATRRWCSPRPRWACCSACGAGPPAASRHRCWTHLTWSTLIGVLPAPAVRRLRKGVGDRRRLIVFGNHAL